MEKYTLNAQDMEMIHFILTLEILTIENLLMVKLGSTISKIMILILSREFSEAR